MMFNTIQGGFTPSLLSRGTVRTSMPLSLKKVGQVEKKDTLNSPRSETSLRQRPKTKAHNCLATLNKSPPTIGADFLKVGRN